MYDLNIPSIALNSVHIKYFTLEDDLLNHCSSFVINKSRRCKIVFISVKNKSVPSRHHVSSG